MNNIAREISTKIHAGQCQAALAMAAAIRAASGSQPEAATALAAIAGTSKDPRILSAAFALWPEAQGSSFSQLVNGLSSKSLAGCLAMRPDLLPRLTAIIKASHRRPAKARREALKSPEDTRPVAGGAVAAPRAIAARRRERGSASPSQDHAQLQAQSRSTERAALTKARMRNLLGFGPIEG